MGVSVVGGATSSGGGLTPFDPAFTYSFSTETSGQVVTIDLTSPIPAGTYTVKGGAAYKGAPYRVKLLTSSGTVVGTGNLTLGTNDGATSYNNPQTYSGEVTASAPFTKVQLLGNTSGSQALFYTGTFGPSTSGYHFTLSAGTRNIAKTDYINNLLTDAGVTTYSNHPTSSPETNLVTTWFWNGSYYCLTQLYTGVPVGGNVNSVKAWRWNYTTSSWAQVGATKTMTDMGEVDISTFAAGFSQNDVYVFKSGKAIIKNAQVRFNTAGNYRVARGQLMVDMVNNTTTYQTYSGAVSELCAAGAAYNPTNDDWYINGRSVYNSQAGTYDRSTNITKLSNTGSRSFGAGLNGTPGTSEDEKIMYVENAASPKLFYTHGEDSNNTLQLYTSSSFGVHTNGTGGPWNDVAYSPNLTYISRPRFVQTNIYGNTNQIIGIVYNSTNMRGYVVSSFSFPTTAPTIDTIPVSTSFQMGNPTPTTWHGGSNQCFAHIQAINATQYGIVLIFSTPVAGQPWSVKTIPLPNAITL